MPIPADDQLEAVFGADGALSRAIPGYRLRRQQVEMAQAIAQAMRDNSLLVAEAGTGTGKTFAYLVPALLAGGKVIISTGTKNLQDQLYKRDLPTVRDALRVPLSTALLKGRANYVCHHHLEGAIKDGRFSSREDVAHLRKIARFAEVSRTGDRAELADVPENAAAWQSATSTRENCLGQDCRQYKDCFVMAARREAQNADIVVVNHHLFFADVMLKDEGMAELLPACNAVIFDEAHQLPETATLFFGENLSSGQLLDLCRDTLVEAIAGAGDVPELRPAVAAVEKASRDARLALPLDSARLNYAAATAKKAFSETLALLEDRLKQLSKLLEAQAQRAEGLANCWRRALDLHSRLERWLAAEPEGMVRWTETYSASFQLNAAPLDIAEIFRKQLQGHPRAWIFTSATLAVNRDFAHYTGEMGLDAARTACWDSPFNYPEQALLYVPEGLPEPNDAAHTAAVVKAAWPVIEASRGRAFLLFTTLRAMRRAHELLQQRFEAGGVDYPLLLQGEGSRSELLERFRRLGNAVLVASQSFWEGVDVRGEALSLVVIDKLPFAPPDDPVLAARIEYLNKQGKNAFMEYQLPRAAISLKQGAGRLIRDEIDRGVLMICDPRLISKHYGRRIWMSLPAMRRTRVLDEVTEFFAAAPVE
ncbi:MAG: ATP-dependent DNA helicase [Betaproteobacteria bacterium]|nr:MAG: ATP-dependent DNA helicase [Betaproteobacteria bacterium]